MFYDAARSPYLENKASGIIFGAILLQLRDNMNFGHGYIPDYVVLQPTAFTGKSISSVEWHYNNIDTKHMEFYMG